MKIDFSKLEKIAEYRNGELQWLEGRDINAVYVILVGDEYYIGSSHYTYLKIGQHVGELEHGHHHSRKLQEKFNKVGEFDVYSLDRGIKRTELIHTEISYIQKYKPSLNSFLMANNVDSKGRVIDNLCDSMKWCIKQKGYTIQDVADKIGVNRVTLTLTLQGNPTYKKMKEIADAIGCNVADFFRDETQEKVEQDKNILTCPKCGARFKLEE